MICRLWCYGFKVKGVGYLARIKPFLSMVAWVSVQQAQHNIKLQKPVLIPPLWSSGLTKLKHSDIAINRQCSVGEQCGH